MKNNKAIFLLIILLCGCTGGNQIQSIKQSNTIVPNVITTNPKGQNAPSSSITPIVEETLNDYYEKENDVKPTIATKLPDIKFRRECFDFKGRSLNNSETFSGSIVLLPSEIGFQPYLLNLLSQSKTVLSQNADKILDEFYVSPNHNNLVFREKPIKPGPTQIYVVANDGKIIYQTPWQTSWRTIIGWLSDDTILISKEQGDDRNDELFKINPFTKNISSEFSDYPGMEEGISLVIPDWESYQYSGIVLDPTLGYALFPSYRDNMWGLSLWDRISNREISYNSGSSLEPPRWAPNGSGVLINRSLEPNSEEARIHEDLFLILKNGKMQQLTELNKKSSSVSIGNYQWSPDGKKIAFWADISGDQYPDIYPNRGPNQNGRIAILDVETNETIDTCIPGFSLSTLVWSPDSKYLVSTDEYEHGNPAKIHTYLINLGEKNAIDLIDNTYALGWLNPHNK